VLRLGCRRSGAFGCLAAILCAAFLLSGRARAGDPPGLPRFDPDKPLSQTEREQRLSALAPGLNPEQVQTLIGAPRHTCRQILYHRSVEQWLYDSTFPVRLVFDCPRGQEPRVQRVQPLAPGGP
jgi:hypothetical protein